MDEVLRLKLDNLAMGLRMVHEDAASREKRLMQMYDVLRVENEHLRVGLELLRDRVRQLEQSGHA